MSASFGIHYQERFDTYVSQRNGGKLTPAQNRRAKKKMGVAFKRAGIKARVNWVRTV